MPILIPYLIFSLVMEKTRVKVMVHGNKSATSKMHLPHSVYWPCDLKFSQLLKTSLATKAVYSKFSIQISRFASLFSVLLALKYIRLLLRICLCLSEVILKPILKKGFKELLISYFPSIAHCKASNSDWLNEKEDKKFLEPFLNDGF